MNRSDCELFRNRIAPYIEGLLDREEANLIQSHLAGCQDCRRIYSELQKVPQLLKDWQPEPPSERIWSQITMELGPRLARKETHRVRHRKRWLWGGALAAAAAIILFIGYKMVSPPVSVDYGLRYDVTFYTDADKSVRREAAHLCKDTSVPAQVEQLTEAERKDLSHFEPPRGYSVFSAGRMKCPCGNPHDALFTLYGGRMPFTMLLLPEECPEGRKVPVDGRCHVKEVGDGRIILAYYHPCGRTVVIMGNISVRDAARTAVGVNRGR